LDRGEGEGERREWVESCMKDKWWEEEVGSREEGVRGRPRQEWRRQQGTRGARSRASARVCLVVTGVAEESAEMCLRPRALLDRRK